MKRQRNLKKLILSVGLLAALCYEFTIPNQAHYDQSTNRELQNPQNALRSPPEPSKLETQNTSRIDENSII